MSKKVLSFLLIAAILLTSTLFSGLVVTAETKTWAVGDQPYAVEGKSNKIEVYNASSATFYDDFVMPTYWTFEDANVVDADTLRSKKSIQLNNANANVIKTGSGTEYLWLDLSSDTDGVNENAYGGTGKAIKVTTASTVGVKNAYTGGYYNAIRRNATSFDCTTFPSFDDIAISFWVKTEGESHFSAAFWDTNTNSGKKLCTDDIYVPEAGEYIIVLPISSFRVSGTGYVKNEDISTFKMQNFEIMFKTAGLAAGETADFYFDNIGIYAIKPNFGKASHSEAAFVKEDFEAYENSETEQRVVTDGTFKWKTSNGSATFSMVDHDGGKAICYQTSSYTYVAPGTVLNSSTALTVNEGDGSYIIRLNQDKTNTNVLGSNATLAFWVKASRATKLTLSTNNNGQSAWITSDEIHIPAGESIVRIPVSKFIEQDSKFQYFRKITINFASAAPIDNTVTKSGSIVFDNFAIEPTHVDGDVNGDKVCDILDVITCKDKEAASYVSGADLYADSKIDERDGIVLRRYLLGNSTAASVTPAVITEESFVESTVSNMDNWKNNAADTLSLNYRKDAPYYHTGSDDTSALEVKYSSLAATSGNKFYYNAYLNTPYSSDSVLTFWVYADQPLDLQFNYLDYSNTENKNVSCKTKTLSIPAGETLVEVPMSDLAATGHDMAYMRTFQLYIHIHSNASSVKTSGTAYFDSFGYYDKDTTNNIPAAQ